MSIFHNTQARPDSMSYAELRRTLHELILILAPWVLLLLLQR